MTAAARTAEPDPEQDLLLDVFTLQGLAVAHTASSSHPGQWWHLWTADGRYLGSANRPELLGALVRHTR
ncbi:hypothetical protein ABZ747_01730 [Kitasatospora cineracea]|uniref:hypothetical protein n=1 Tax=Kitasatospora cineracea TaxID=88074 RepID=UPI0033EDEAF1